MVLPVLPVKIPVNRRLMGKGLHANPIKVPSCRSCLLRLNPKPTRIEPEHWGLLGVEFGQQSRPDVLICEDGELWAKEEGILTRGVSVDVDDVQQPVGIFLFEFVHIVH